MSKRTAWVLGAVAAVTMMPACDEPPAASDEACACGEVATRSTQVNGARLNGARLNTARLNGARLNGARLNGPDGSSDYIELTMINVQGDGAASEAWLSGSSLLVRTNQDEVVSGAELDSAKLHFDVQEGGSLKSKLVKILDVEPLAPGSDVWLFDVSVKVAGAGWEPLCLDNADEPTQAILLSDVWDGASGDRIDPGAGGITFACRDAALAKCVEWGYRPWDPDLRELHQACTRLVRADYCGDGVAHTTQGTLIHVLDQAGIQTVDPTREFVIEAEWGPDGAVCLNPANMRLGEAALGCELPACGAAFASGGLIQSGKIVAGP